jgi:hypothetical protein
MRRRLVGVVVILVACLALATVAGVDRTRIRGAAQLPAGVPVVGSCSTWDPDPLMQDVYFDTPEQQLTLVATPYTYPSATIKDCSQPHDGLLVSVDFSTVPPETATLSQISTGDTTCQPKTDAWLSGRGMVPFDDRRGTADIHWVPAVTVVGRSVGPDTAGRAGGAAWWGCELVTLGDEFFGPANAALPGMCIGVRLKFLTSVRVSGYTAESTPPASVPCYQAHPGQVLAFADVMSGDLSPAQVKQSCQVAASRYIGTSDPGFGKSIMIESVPGNDTLCYAEVKSNHLLKGSLLGLGNGPLPWAS